MPSPYARSGIASRPSSRCSFQRAHRLAPWLSGADVPISEGGTNDRSASTTPHASSSRTRKANSLIASSPHARAGEPRLQGLAPSAGGSAPLAHARSAPQTSRQGGDAGAGYWSSAGPRSADVVGASPS